MQVTGQEEVRALFNRWVTRKGKGAITTAAKALNVSRQHLSRFRNGDALGEPHRQHLVDLMAADGYHLPGSRAQETPEPYAVRQKSANEIIADHLRILADTLTSTAFDADDKAEQFVIFVERCHASLDAYAARIKEST